MTGSTPESSHRRPSPSLQGFTRRNVTRYRRDAIEQTHDAVAEEVPMAMLYNGQPFAVMMATPLDLEDFALGFSLSEGLIRRMDDLLDVQVHRLVEGIELAMRVNATDGPIDASRQRLLPGRSGCGLCGARTLEDAVRQPAVVGAGVRIDADTLQRALAALRDAQPINAETGSVHAAAWVDTDGDIVLVREDVGRHNALDKLIGAMLRAGIDPEQGFLVVTSRASYEMVTKAASAGITLMAAISAPTALAIGLAQCAGLTLIGFARPGSMVVYAHGHRLLPS